MSDPDVPDRPKSYPNRYAYLREAQGYPEHAISAIRRRLNADPEVRAGEAFAKKGDRDNGRNSD